MAPEVENSADKNPPELAVGQPVSEDAKVVAEMTEPNKPRFFRKRTLAVCLLIVLAIVGSGTYLLTKNKPSSKLGPDVLAQVDKKDITKKDLQQRLWVKARFANKQEDQDIKGPDAQASLEELIEQAIIEPEATKLGISDQKSDIEKYLKDQSFTLADYLTDQQKQFLFDYHKLGYLKKAVSDKVVDWKELEYVEIPVWIRYFKDNEGYKSDLIYSKNLGQQIYESWKDGKIDYAGAVKMAEDDERLGRKAVVDLYGLKYLGFGTKLDIESYKTSSQVDYKKLFGGLKAGFNEPVLLVTNLSDLETQAIGSNPVRTEVSMVIAHVTKANSTPNASPSYEEWLKKVTTSHKVVKP